MRIIPALDVNRSSRRIVSALASFAVALTIVRFGIADARRELADLDRV